MRSREDVFARADVDTGLYSDPKVVALARRLRDPHAIAAHVALYQALVLGSWGAAERLTLEQAMPAWWLDPADTERSNLAAVGLIDEDGRIPTHAWETWFTPALERRRARQEAGRRGGSHKPSASRASALPEPASSPAQPSRPTNQPADHPSIHLAPAGATRSKEMVIDSIEPAVQRA